MPQDLDEPTHDGGSAGAPPGVEPEHDRLRTSLTTSTVGLGDLGPALDALADETQAPASMSWASLDVWLSTHPDEAPHVVLVHRGPELVAAALLTRRPERTWTRYGKAGVPGEPFRLLHVDDDAAGALVRGVVESLPRHRTRVLLEDLPDPDRTTDQLAAALAVRPRATEPSPVLDVSDASGERSLTRNTRQAVAKAKNRARREGRDLRSRWVGDPDEVEAALPSVVELHVRRNSDHGRDALLLDATERAQFEETLRAQARAGRVRLLLTTIDGDLAGFAVCLTSSQRWWAWSNYADPAWLHYSPGTVSNAEVVRAATDDPDVDDVDWGRGLQRYKLSGPVRLEGRQRLEAASPGVARLMRAERVARSVRRRLRLGQRLRLRRRHGLRRHLRLRRRRR